MPGDPAWEAGLRPGDKIIQFGDGNPNEKLRFEMDLLNSVVFTGADRDLPLVVRRYETGRIDHVVVRPTNAHKAENNRALIGVAPTATTTIADINPDSPADHAKPPFAKGDKIVAIKAGQETLKTDDFFQLQAALAAHRSEPVTYVVDREDKEKPVAVRQRLEIEVAPNPYRYLGVVMGMGPVTAVQKDSPADKAGFKAGDLIVSVAEQPAGDPLRFPELVRPRAGKETKFEVRRKDASGAETVVALKAVPEPPKYFDPGRGPNAPWSCEELGVAYTVLNTVASIDPSAPAAAKTLQPGDEILSANFVPVDDAQGKEYRKLRFPDKPMEFDADHLNWPYLQTLLQLAPKNPQVELKYRRAKQEQKVLIPAIVAPNWFNVQRGTILEPLTRIRKANTWLGAFKLGVRETKESVFQVATVLKKLINGEISPSILGGPFTIAAVAADSASQGITKLLIFLTLLSGNLAVINFLPIPILDGGHMMFLLYEGIRGKPASERVLNTLTYVGLGLILTLMIFVLVLDIPRMYHWISSLFN